MDRLLLWFLITREFDEILKGEKQMMVVNFTASASTDNKIHWHNINCKKYNKVVKSYQTRIVKAIQESRWNKVKALQRLLTNSFSCKAIAVRRVIENRGKRTAGVDGETWSTPDLKSHAIFNLRQHGYNLSSLRRIYIPKSNSQHRPLDIPTMRDRSMQAFYIN